MAAILEEAFFGIPLSTHRSRETEHAPFPYELTIAAIAIAFFRGSIYQSKEPQVYRILYMVILVALTYTNQPYDVIITVEMVSYLVPFLLMSPKPTFVQKLSMSKLWLTVVGSMLSAFLFCHAMATGVLPMILRKVTPTLVTNGIAALLPTKEVQAAYDIMDRFVLEPGLLRAQVSRLLFITCHIQVGIGYLGIDFLTKEQQRRNELVRMDLIQQDNDDDDGKQETDNDKESTNQTKRLKNARKFQKSALPFILYTAVPYMIQIIGYGNLNAFAYACFRDDVHRAVRLYDLFAHENNLVAVAEHSAKSPDAYAQYMDTIVSTTYDLFNRKLFSLPKVLLLPVVMARQPKMMAQIFPIVFLADWCKGRAVSFMTTRIEKLQRDSQEISAMRSKIEAFDIKNAELLQRSGAGAIEFTGKRWEELTVQVQMKTVVMDLTVRTKGFFAWIERNFVFSVLVDCALAHLIAVGKIVAADIFVFSRAIEDAVDMALMKSRSEAELARMMTQIDNMKGLADVWDGAQSRSLIPCTVNAQSPAISLSNVHYSRGTAVVKLDQLTLNAGIYALTGANGSGKSTLFRVLMSCSSNARSIDLPPSIILSSSLPESQQTCEANVCMNTQVESSDVGGTGPLLGIAMPSSNVVEISQTFYWPLYSRPIDWILSGEKSEGVDQRLRKVAEELNALEFAQSVENSKSAAESSEDVISGIMEQLVDVKEDWFNDLSGGQRSKVELVRKVFLQDACPQVLLVDETMAPLDPRSKSLVMQSIKSFCSKSVVIVIYHTDVGREQEGGDGGNIECVPSNDFFDGNIHVENQTLNLRPVCEKIEKVQVPPPENLEVLPPSSSI